MKHFTMSRKNPIIQYGRIPFLILLYLGIWQLLSMLVGSSLLLPSPLETGSRLILIMRDPACWKDLGFTLMRLLGGYLIGAAIGIILAILTAKSKAMHFVLSPLRVLIRSTPILSFVLLLLVSIASGFVPVTVVAIMVAPMLWATTEQAILSLDAKLIEMGKIYFSPWKRFRLVYLPQMLPQILASAVTALGFAWKSVITAEVLSLPKFAIGNRMYFSKIYLETPDLIAWTVLVVLLSLLMEKVLNLLVRKGVQRYDTN